MSGRCLIGPKMVAGLGNVNDVVQASSIRMVDFA
jgi:hypothetical protein